MSTQDKVLSIVSFEDIADDDLRGGIKVYSNIELQVASLQSGVAPWVWQVAHRIFIKSEGIPLVAAADLKAAMEAEVEWVTSKDAGALRLKNSQAMLTGQSPLAKAYRKIYGAMALGGSLNDLLSAHACEKWRVDKNKELAATKEEADREQQIIDHCKVALLREDSALDFDNDETAALMLSEAVDEYKASQKDADVNHLAVLDGDGEESVVLDEFDAKGKELAVALRELYESTLSMVGDNETVAMEQVMATAESSLNSWKARIQKHVTSRLEASMADDSEAA